MRVGTYLAGPEGLPVPPVPNLQAPGEALMLAESARHFARLGQLDAIGEVLQGARDPAHTERIEEVYRRERQRFFTTMRRLMLARQAAWLGEGP